MSGARHSAGRRRFVQLVGWASVIASGGGPALAQVAAKRAKSTTPPTPQPSPPAAAEKPPEISEEARALGEVVQRRYGGQLDGQELEAVVRDLDSDVRAMKKLREVKLANSDEPDVTFHA